MISIGIILYCLPWAVDVHAARLDWKDNSQNEDGFIIERLAAGWDELARVGVDVTTYTDPGIIEACYRVRAYNAAGISAPSNTACLLRAPTLLIVTEDQRATVP